MKVREVGVGSVANSGFVELQMYSSFQNSVGGHAVQVYDGTSLAHSYTMTTGVIFDDNQRTILLGDTFADGVPDFEATSLNIDAILAGGAVCFPDAIPPDCIEWGTGTTATLPDEQSAAATALASSMSLTRSISAGCATLLEGADDTDSSAADFSLGSPTPRNNSVTPTETACSSPPPPGGGGTTPTQPAPKKKKCKKAKKRSAGAAAKKCKKKRK